MCCEMIWMLGRFPRSWCELVCLPPAASRHPNPGEPSPNDTHTHSRRATLSPRSHPMGFFMASGLFIRIVIRLVSYFLSLTKSHFKEMSMSTSNGAFAYWNGMFERRWFGERRIYLLAFVQSFDVIGFRVEIRYTTLCSFVCAITVIKRASIYARQVLWCPWDFQINCFLDGICHLLNFKCFQICFRRNSANRLQFPHLFIMYSWKAPARF